MVQSRHIWHAEIYLHTAVKKTAGGRNFAGGFFWHGVGCDSEDDQLPNINYVIVFSSTPVLINVCIQT